MTVKAVATEYTKQSVRKEEKGERDGAIRATYIPDLYLPSAQLFVRSCSLCYGFICFRKLACNGALAIRIKGIEVSAACTTVKRVNSAKTAACGHFGSGRRRKGISHVDQEHLRETIQDQNLPHSRKCTRVALPRPVLSPTRECKSLSRQEKSPSDASRHVELARHAAQVTLSRW